jgi:hypothetical protein
MWLEAIVVVLCAAVAVEYRLRRPDQLILAEEAGKIVFRRFRWYPRHFSLPLPATTHMLEMRVEASAKGGLPVIVRIAASVAASRSAVDALVRVGGWSTSAVVKAAKEFEAIIQARVRTHAEKASVEELSSDRLRTELLTDAGSFAPGVGLEIVSLTVQSIDPSDPAIAEALRKRESARILETTEAMEQRARVAAAQAKLKADELIAAAEHEAAMKQLELRKVEEEREAGLAHVRVEEELSRNQLRLEFEREELKLLKENPQLLLLSPQAARLAEASQSLRNARTVVSLGNGEGDQGARLLGLFQLFLEQVLNGPAGGAGKKVRP